MYICGAESVDFSNKQIKCARELKHLGKHWCESDGRFIAWSEYGGKIATPRTPDYHCKLCGILTEDITQSYSLREFHNPIGLCFDCALWRARVIDAQNDPTNIRIIDGKFFTIPKNPDRTGPARFSSYIEIATGKVFPSSQMWYGGVIPEHFKDQLQTRYTFYFNNSGMTIDDALVGEQC